MTLVRFQQTSPPGVATIDSNHVRVDLGTAKVWINGVPASAEQSEALAGHFGSAWRDMIAAMTELADG